MSLVSEKTTRIRVLSRWSHFIVVEYPAFNDPRAKKATDYWTGKLVDSLQTQLKELSGDDPEILDRWSEFTHAWFEVFYWDDNFLSGKWIIQRSWSGEEWSVPVNYSIREDEIMNIEQQFKPDFDMDFFLGYYVQQGVKELPEYRNLLIRNKLKESAFQHLNFCREGLLLSTGFDTLFGSFQLVVPYDEIYPYLRKRSLLKKLVDKRYDD